MLFALGLWNHCMSLQSARREHWRSLCAAHSNCTKSTKNFQRGVWHFKISSEALTLPRRSSRSSSHSLFIPTWHEWSTEPQSDRQPFQLSFSSLSQLQLFNLFDSPSFIQSSLALMYWEFNYKSQRSLIIENQPSVNVWGHHQPLWGSTDIRCCFMPRRELWAEWISLALSKTALTTTNGFVCSLSWWSRLANAILLHYSPPLFFS